MRITNIEVKLSDVDGNVFYLLEIVCNELKRNNIEKEIIDNLKMEVVTAKTYKDVLLIFNKYVKVN